MAFYTLIETAKLNEFKPEAYLRDVLTRLVIRAAGRTLTSYVDASTLTFIILTDQAKSKLSWRYKPSKKSITRQNLCLTSSDELCTSADISQMIHASQAN